MRGVNDPFGSPGRVSDVQGKVAQFNSLSRETTQKRKDNEAALKRAVVGREEAESELRRLKESNGDLKRKIGEYEQRERKVGLRLESKMVRSMSVTNNVRTESINRKSCKTWKRTRQRRLKVTVG